MMTSSEVLRRYNASNHIYKTIFTKDLRANIVGLINYKAVNLL